MSLKGLRFTLEVDGQEPDTFAVVNFRLIQNQSYPFVMSVDVASDSFMQPAEMLLEKNATLTIWQGVIPLRYVTGVVAGFGMQENNGWQMRYHLRIEPPLWRCGLRRNFRIFQQQDIRTISATLLNENGVTEWTPLFYEDHPAREFCVQYGESDLAFLARLWAEEGIFFFERFAADSPEQKLTTMWRGCHRRGSFRLTRTHRQERRRSVSVCSVMRRMSARHRCRARITRLRCRTGRGCMSSRVRA